MRLVTYLLLAIAFAVIQCLIGGAKLVYSLPAYVIFGAAGVSLLLAAKHNEVSVRPRQLCIYSAIALAGYVITRSLFSPVNYLARADLFMVLGALLVYSIAAIFFTSGNQRMLVIWTLLAFAIVHVVIGMVQFHRENFMLLPWIFRPEYGVRASGFYICPNHLAGLLEILAMLACAACAWGRGAGWMRIVAALAAVICLVGVAITGSRGGYISSVTGLLAFSALSGWMIRWLRSRQFFVFLAVALVGLTVIIGGGLYFMLKNPWLASRVDQIYDPTNMRILLWQASLKQFALQPLVGTGSGTYDFWGRHFRSETVQNDPVHVHNDYLELLAEYGVAGSVLMLLFLGTHVHSAFRGIRRIVRARLKPSGRRTSNELALIIGCLSGLTALLVHSIMDFNLHIPANTLLVAFLFGILANPTEAQSRSETGNLDVPAWLRFSPVALGLILIIAAAPLIRGEYFSERARVALRDQAYPEAKAFAAKAIALDKKNPDAFFYLGESQHFLGLMTHAPQEQGVLFANAANAFKDGLGVFPQDLRLKLKLGRTLDMMHLFDDADRVLREALLDDPNFGNVYAYYGLHMHLQHRWKKAAAFYRKAQTLQEKEISAAGLQDLDHDRSIAAENAVLPFAAGEDDEEDDDLPVPPVAAH